MPLPGEPDQIDDHARDERQGVAHDHADEKGFCLAVERDAAQAEHDQLDEPCHKDGQNRGACGIKRHHSKTNGMQGPPRKTVLAQGQNAHSQRAKGGKAHPKAVMGFLANVADGRHDAIVITRGRHAKHVRAKIKRAILIAQINGGCGGGDERKHKGDRDGDAQHAHAIAQRSAQACGVRGSGHGKTLAILIQAAHLLAHGNRIGRQGIGRREPHHARAQAARGFEKDQPGHGDNFGKSRVKHEPEHRDHHGPNRRHAPLEQPEHHKGRAGQKRDHRHAVRHQFILIVHTLGLAKCVLKNRLEVEARNPQSPQAKDDKTAQCLLSRPGELAQALG